MHTFVRSVVAAWGAFCLFGTVVAEAQIDARLLRQPDVSATEIAFVYGGDIWIVDKDGGVANRLSTPKGEESFPRFSPDGASIAFTGNYDGNSDIYVMPVGGGLPTRLTHHPDRDRMLDWYPDGGVGPFCDADDQRETDAFNKLYRVPATGGLPAVLPVPYGEFGAISPDGATLAYMPLSRDFRTWKRYRGGTAPEIWLFGLQTTRPEISPRTTPTTASPCGTARPCISSPIVTRTCAPTSGPTSSTPAPYGR